MSANAMVHPEPPRLSHSLLEVTRFFWEAGSSAVLGPLSRILPRGDGHAVMTLPGFYGADGSMASLRRFLDRQGYRALPWGLGRNIPDDGIRSLRQALEFRLQVETELVNRLSREKRESGKKVSLIGWSLGGLYATGVAHRHPDIIRQVVTLGTPFGDPRATSVYKAMQRVYRAEVSPGQLDEWIAYTFEGELEVPVTALYSQSDGFVGDGIARLPDHDLMENIAVMASHVGFPFNPLVRAVLAERLAQPDGQWRPFDRKLRPFVQRTD